MGEYYSYTGDLDMLEKKIYPVMEESALLWSQVLVGDKKSGRLVVSPCFSAEHGPVSKGGTFEQSIVLALFDSVIKFSSKLEENGRGSTVNRELIEKIKTQRERLLPHTVTKSGFIREWADEDSFLLGGRLMGVQKHHRHISHLLGVYPFSQITKNTPELHKAASASLAFRNCRKQANNAVMALKEHFRHACGKAEVAVNLERRMSAEHIFENGCFENLRYDLFAFLTLSEPCAAKQTVRQSPACGFDSDL